MPFITLTEAKNLIQSTTTIDNVLINTLIPLVYEDFFSYTNCFFESTYVKVLSSNISCSSSGVISITDTNFSTWGFYSGDDIKIKGSFRNDGIYMTSSISSGTIAISSVQSLKPELVGQYIKISQINFPESLKLVIATMIKARLENPGGNPVSESLGDYSIVYGKGDYPQSVMAQLNKYCRVYVA